MSAFRIDAAELSKMNITDHWEAEPEEQPEVNPVLDLAEPVLKGLIGLNPSNGTALSGANKMLKRANLAPELGKTGYQPPKYPVEALGSLAELAKEISIEGQVDVAMVGQSILGVLSLMTQGIYTVETLAGNAPLSLFLLTLAGSGEGKSTAERVLLSAVRSFEKKQHERFIAENNADNPVREPYLISNDATVQGIIRSFKHGWPSQGIFTAEAAAMLCGWGMSAEQKLNTAGGLNRLWDGEAIAINRAGEGRTQLYNRRLCAHLLIQPDAAWEAINDSALSEIGLWPRFLIAWPAELKPRKFRPYDYSKSRQVGKFWQRCNAILSTVICDEETGEIPEFKRITLTPEARITLQNHFEQMEQARDSEHKLNIIKPFAVRACEQVCRIAGCLAAFDNHGQDQIRIDNSTLQNAIRLVDYNLEIWQGIFGNREQSEHETWAKKLYEWLCKRPDLIATEKDMLQRGPKSLRTRHKRDIALAVLQDYQMIVPVVESADSRKIPGTWQAVI